jgi:hypothetical protein
VVRNRYKGVRPTARSAFWWLHAQISSFPSGRSLVIALTQRDVVRYGIDGSRVIGEVPAEDTGLGFFAASLDTTTLKPGQQTGVYHPMGYGRMDRSRHFRPR